jgi:WD40 repeat protein
MEFPYEAYTVWMAPLDGGVASQFLPMPSSYQVMPQPGGSEWVAFGPGVNPALSVVSPGGGLLRTYSSSSPSSARVGAFFSPLGRWLVVVMEPDGVLSVADAQTQTPRVLQGQPLSAGPGAWVRFSPGESSLAFTAAVDGGCRSELLQLDGGVLASADTGCSNVDAWVEMDPSDQWALVRGPTDQVVSLAGAASTDLGRVWVSLDGAPSFFTGDGRRLTLRESVSPPSRVFTADPRSGQLRYVADDDGAWIGAVPGSPALIVIEDASRIPPGVSAVQPPGLYVLVAP